MFIRGELAISSKATTLSLQKKKDYIRDLRQQIDHCLTIYIILAWTCDHKSIFQMTPSPYTHAIIAHAHKPSIPLWSILRNQTYYMILYYIIIFLSYCSCHVTTSTICLPPSPSFPIFGLWARVCSGICDCDCPNLASKSSSDISSCGWVIVMASIVRFELPFVGDDGGWWSSGTGLELYLGFVDFVSNTSFVKSAH